jgi:hypothetical protein
VAAARAWGDLHAVGEWRWIGQGAFWDRDVLGFKCPIRLVVYPTTGTVMVDVRASEQPLEPSEIDKLSGVLMGMFGTQRWPWHEPRVVSVEINQDFRAFRLKGSKVAEFFLGGMALRGQEAMGLGQLQGAILRIYNKDELNVMRMELRLKPKLLNLDLTHLQGLVEHTFYGPTKDPHAHLKAPGSPVERAEDAERSVAERIRNDSPDYSWV